MLSNRGAILLLGEGRNPAHNHVLNPSNTLFNRVGERRRSNDGLDQPWGKFKAVFQRESECWAGTFVGDHAVKLPN
jgi:hypothetical protein